MRAAGSCELNVHMNFIIQIKVDACETKTTIMAT